MIARRTLLALAALAATGCSSGGKLEIRSIGDLGSKRPASDQLALAAGELAIGNVGLALESYRRALRDRPNSVDALTGIGICYDRMGRFDLSRRAYEQALAIAPAQPALYQALAASLNAEGLPAEAAAVRREAAARLAAVSAPVLTPSGSVAIMPEIVTVAAPTASVTIVLAPPRPASAPKPGARLERLSSGEVALLTSSASPWKVRTAATALRFASLRFDRRETLVVLNGARVAGLAARTRTYLQSRGFAWSRIGDAATIASRTEVRFAPGQRERALRVAAQFPFATPVAVATGPLTLVVGRDAPVMLLRRG